jgi:hypothetical protein
MSDMEVRLEEEDDELRETSLLRTIRDHVDDGHTWKLLWLLREYDNDMPSPMRAFMRVAVKAFTGMGVHELIETARLQCMHDDEELLRTAWPNEQGETR